MNDKFLEPVPAESSEADPSRDASRLTAEDLQSACDQLDLIIDQCRDIRARLAKMLRRETPRFDAYAFLRRFIA